MLSLYFKEISLNIFLLLRYILVKYITILRDNHSCSRTSVYFTLTAKCSSLYSLTNSFTRQIKFIPYTKIQIQEQVGKKKKKKEEKGLYRDVEEKTWVWVILICTYLAERTLWYYRLCLCPREVSLNQLTHTPSSVYEKIQHSSHASVGRQDD